MYDKTHIPHDLQSYAASFYEMKTNHCCIDNNGQPRHCHSAIPSSMATCIKLVLETNGKETAMYLLLEHFIPSSMATCIKLVLETNGKETAMYLLLEHFP
jgi:hypothetical protein